MMSKLKSARTPNVLNALCFPTNCLHEFFGYYASNRTRACSKLGCFSNKRVLPLWQNLPCVISTGFSMTALDRWSGMQQFHLRQREKQLLFSLSTL